MPRARPRWRGIAEVEPAPGVGGAQVLDALAGRWAGNLRWVGVSDAPGEPLRAGSRTTGPDHGLLGLEGRWRKVYGEGGEAGARTKGSTRPAVNSGSSRSSGCGRRRFPGPPRIFSPSSNAARIRGWSPTDGAGGRFRGSPRVAPGCSGSLGAAVSRNGGDAPGRRPVRLPPTPFSRPDCPWS